MKNKQIIFLSAALLVLTALCRPVNAQPNSNWEFAGWYGGGCYPNVAFDPANPKRVYLTSDVAGIWESNDLGDHWEFITNGLADLTVPLIAIAPSDFRILYAGTNGGLYLSRNAGQSWSLCNRYDEKISFVRPANYRSIAISSKDPGQVFIGTAEGSVLKSEDFGQSWSILGGEENPFGEKVPVTALVLIDGRFLFVGSTKGLMRFSFSTNRWTKIGNGPDIVLDLDYMDEGAGFLFAAGKERLFYSKDLGSTWEQSAAVSRGMIHRVSTYRSSDGQTHLAVVWEKGWDGGVFLSHDFGRTWISTERQMHGDLAADPTRVWQRNGGRTTAIKISPENSKIMFRTDGWGVWRSDDGGESWNEKIMGAPDTVGSDLAIDGKGQIYVATMDNGLLKSSDHGGSYQVLFPQKGYRADRNGHVWRVLISQEGKRIIATSSPWGENINQVILSEDGGKNFSIIREGLPLKRPKKNTIWGEGYPRALAQDPKNSDVVYLGIDGDDGGGLFISRDGGKTWKLSPGQPGSRKIYNALAVDPTDSKRIFWGACGSGGGVYLSEDGGISWKHVLSKMAWVFDLAISDRGTLFAGGDQGGPVLNVSADHGQKWKLLKRFEGKGTVEAITIDRKNPKRIALSTVQWGSRVGGKIYLTVDGGKHWQDITEGLPSGTGAAAMSFNEDGSYLYLIRYAASVYRIKL